jgi:hypothetical protein
MYTCVPIFVVAVSEPIAFIHYGGNVLKGVTNLFQRLRIGFGGWPDKFIQNT